MSNLSIVRGDDELLDIAVTDEDTGLPVDLTGSHLWFMVKRRPGDDDADALLSLETPTDVALTAGTGGLATVTIDDTDTDLIEPGAYWWELQSRDVPGKIATLAGGRITIARDIVREIA